MRSRALGALGGGFGAAGDPGKIDAACDSPFDIATQDVAANRADVTTASGVELTPNLAEQIEAEHQAAIGAARSAIEHAVECGRLLLEAKVALPHGQWLPWLDANTSVSARQSQRYMKLAAAVLEGKCDVASYLTVEGALAALVSPKADAAPEIDDALNVLGAHGVRKMALDELLDLGCIVTRVSLSLPKGLAFEDWCRIGNLLRTLEHDQIALHEYGQKLLQAVERLKPFQEKIRAAVEVGEARPDFANWSMSRLGVDRVWRAMARSLRQDHARDRQCQAA